MEQTESNTKYKEIQKLYEFCVKIGVAAEIQQMYDGFHLGFPNGDDFVQHKYSYGSNCGCVEPAIGCRKDYTAVSLNAAKSLVKYHKERLNRRATDERAD